MKKIIKIKLAVIIAALLAATLTACAGSEVAPPPTPTPALEATPTPPPSPSPTPTPAPTPTPEPELEHTAEADDSPFPFFAFPYEFSLVDTLGNALTQEELGEKRAFFVYQWAVWCPSCIVAMPELSRISREYEDYVGFIGLLIANSYEEIEIAASILEENDFPATFRSVIVVVSNDLLIPEGYSDQADYWIDMMGPFFDWFGSVSTGFIPNYVVLTQGNDFPGSTSDISETIPILSEIVGS